MKTSVLSRYHFVLAGLPGFAYAADPASLGDIEVLKESFTGKYAHFDGVAYTEKVVLAVGHAKLITAFGY